MTNERDELARIIASNHTAGAVDKIVAAGYRKPPTIDNDKLVIDDGMLLLDVGSCTCTPYGSSHERHCGVEYLDDLTKPLERAGYSKPKQVTTVEETSKLPKGSVILSHLGGVWTKHYEHFHESHNWEAKGARSFHPNDLPATVLHIPGRSL